MADLSSVEVAVRIRPPIARELIDACQICTSVTPGQPQVWIGGSHAFTYDHVYDQETAQSSVFDIVRPLVDGCLEGYNATILAYGQTGSGKTYTMGTGFDLRGAGCCDITEEQGIIPRAVHHLFSQIKEAREKSINEGKIPPEFKVTVQFVELYNEDIIDLNDAAKIVESRSSTGSLCSLGARGFGTSGGTGQGDILNCSPRAGLRTASHTTLISDHGHTSTHAGKRGLIKIHEDANGGIYMVGVTARPVSSEQETMKCLRDGALSRTTASTNMNDQSSRSHAIFTLHVVQQRLSRFEEESETQMNGESNGMSDYETLSAKFHFVDLAGSERLKRTGAVGDRAKEGISINCGLLALGNVISALGDKSKKITHVPYRDSKLTRLLQDSLGGNSKTIMIACVSPCDRDFVETLNTLKYANRARNIKNKITVNQDKSSRTINILRIEIQTLQMELLEYKQGKRLPNGADGDDSMSDACRENVLLKNELEMLRSRIKAKQETIDQLTTTVSELSAKLATGAYGEGNMDEPIQCDLTAMVQKYMKEIEEFKAKLLESESTCEQLRKAAAVSRSSPMRPSSALSPRYGTTLIQDHSNAMLIQEAMKSLEQEKEILDKLKTKPSPSAKVNGKIDESPEEDGADSLSSPSSGEEDSEEEDDTSENEGEAKYTMQLAELTTEIGIKQRLIEELQMSQERMEAMRAHYEDKLSCLMTRIKATEEERDKVLNSLNSQKSTPDNKVKQVKDDYERKLQEMKVDLKKLQGAQKEHSKMIRDQGQKQIQTLRNELESMKKMKVKLIKEMKEESVKWRNLELQRNKEIAKLKKEQRKKDNEIKALEAAGRTREIVLRRKHEEVTALKKQNRLQMSKRAAGILTTTDKTKPFSPLKAKQEWSKIRTTMLKNAYTKRTVYNLEKEMLVQIDERKRLKEHLAQLLKSKEVAESNGGHLEEIKLFKEDIETVNENLEYVEDKINELQNSIADVGDSNSKDEEGPDMIKITGKLNKNETSYLLRKIYENSIDLMNDYSQASQNNQELNERLKQSNKEIEHLKELVEHVYMRATSNPESFGNEEFKRSSYSTLVEGTELGQEITPASTTASLQGSVNGNGSLSNNGSESRHTLVRNNTGGMTNFGYKARRLTATTKELLGSLEAPAVMTKSTNMANDFEFAKPELPPSKNTFQRTNSLRLNPSTNRRITFDMPPQNSLLHNSKMTNGNGHGVLEPTPSSARGININYNNRKIGVAKRAALAQNINKNTTYSAKEMDTSFLDEIPSGVTPPGSPNSQRRNNSNRDDNVFQRLTSSTRIVERNEVNNFNGEIKPIRDRQGASTRPLLINTHVAEGHSKSVLSVCATEHKLFTGSKDATVKIWDLGTGKEINTLSGHPNNVVCVRYLEENHLVLSVSLCYIKIWDIRSPPTSCVKVIQSSGNTVDENIKFDPNERLTNVPSGEFNIPDVVVVPQTNSLYTPYDNKIRFWDLREFSSYGVLSGKHNSNVMTMTAQVRNNIETLVSGSKDHYIKVYNFTHDGSKMATNPTKNLEPPHYDGIQSLALSGSTLFTGSRDFCIKKWDLDSLEMVHSANNVHNNWVTGLSFAPRDDNILLSASKDGWIKVWSTDSLRELGKVEASKGFLECITTNSSTVFTGSSHGHVKLWRLSQSRLNSVLFCPSPFNRKKARQDQDIMTMSTGRLFGLSIEGPVYLWKPRNSEIYDRLDVQ